jgi:hypothetical protein
MIPDQLTQADSELLAEALNSPEGASLNQGLTYDSASAASYYASEPAITKAKLQALLVAYIATLAS